MPPFLPPLRYSILVLALLLAGCATPYQSRGFAGGFSETQVNARTFLVSFRGNGFTSQEQAGEMVLLRAADLTLQKGFHSFIVAERREGVRHSRVLLPAQSNTTGQVVGDPYAPGGATYTATTSTVGGESVHIRKPRPQLSIVMLTEAEARQQPLGSVVYDAQLLASQLRPKYAAGPS